MFVTNCISTTKIQKISEITNFFRHYFLSRTEVKALKNQKFIRLLPLQGALLIAIIPRAMPWARSFCPFRACCFWSFWPSALSGRAASGTFGLQPVLEPHAKVQ